MTTTRIEFEEWYYSEDNIKDKKPIKNKNIKKTTIKKSDTDLNELKDEFDKLFA
jgi:hypothetical protein